MCGEYSDAFKRAYFLTRRKIEVPYILRLPASPIRWKTTRKAELQRSMTLVATKGGHTSLSVPQKGLRPFAPLV